MQEALPATLADGLHTLEVGGETFRVLVKTTASGERIAVAQESGFRNEIARDGHCARDAFLDSRAGAAVDRC
jgi:hypothetical protein